MVDVLRMTPQVRVWLGTTRQAQVLHIFDKVCNLRNEADEIISIVQPEVGNGPFALVVAETRPFPEIISLDLPIVIRPGQLQIGQMLLDLSTATSWQPQVDWQTMRQNRLGWQNKLPEMINLLRIYQQHIGPETAVVQTRLKMGLTKLLKGIHLQDEAAIQDGTHVLAGLGRGLTPAGDDLLLGVMVGLLATWPRVVCQPLLDLIVQTAVPRTTTLSAAWLKAAGRGEANELWHTFVAQLSVNSDRWQQAFLPILETGHSSGADALWGFTAVVEKLSDV